MKDIFDWLIIAIIALGALPEFIGKAKKQKSKYGNASQGQRSATVSAHPETGRVSRSTVARTPSHQFDKASSMRRAEPSGSMQTLPSVSWTTAKGRSTAADMRTRSSSITDPIVDVPSPFAVEDPITDPAVADSPSHREKIDVRKFVIYSSIMRPKFLD